MGAITLIIHRQPSLRYPARTRYSADRKEQVADWSYHMTTAVYRDGYMIFLQAHIVHVFPRSFRSRTGLSGLMLSTGKGRDLANGMKSGLSM